MKAVHKSINEKYLDQERNNNVWILPIGKKAYDYFLKRNFQVIDDYYKIFSELSFDKAREIAEFVMNGFVNHDFDRVELVYNEFKNVATQVTVTDQFLPMANEEPKEEVESSTEYIFEPSVEFIVKEVIPKTLKIKFYKAILESNASEHGARMTAMSQATDNAGELIKDLKLVYNRTRQAAITTEILEIVGGAEGLKGN